MRAIATDPVGESLDAIDQEVMSFATRVARNASWSPPTTCSGCGTWG